MDQIAYSRGFESGELGGHYWGLQKAIFSSFEKSSVLFARWVGADDCCRVNADDTPAMVWDSATDLIQGIRVFLSTFT